MNTTELKALAEALTFHGRYGYETEDVASKRRIHRNADASAAILELIAQLEDAQGEIRALRATEQALRERVKALEESLQNFADDFEGCYADGEPAMIRARALLEQKP